MNHRFSLPVLLAAFLVIAFTQSGCKENTLINSKISPSDTALGVFTTELGCITHTYFDDTAITGYYINNADYHVYHGIGSITDEFFGTMTGASSFQLIPDQPNTTVYDNTTIDSAALILPYGGFLYGDTTDQTLTQSYQAFFLDEDLSANTLYYSYTTKQIDQANPLSEPVTVNLYHLKDSLSVNNVKYHPGLRIKLKLPVLLNRLMPALTAAAANPGDPNTPFKSVFKGVCVKVANSLQTTKAYPFFRLDGKSNYTGAGIIVYYHPNGTTTDTNTQRYFFNGESCGFFNSVRKTFSHSPVSSLLNSTQPGDSIIAIQNQPGACLDIKIPGITSLPSGVINKAQLQLTLLPQYDNKYTPVARLYPRKVSNGTYPAGTTAGTLNDVADRYNSGVYSFGIMDGTLRTINRNGTDVQAYTIGIPLEVMSSWAAKNDTLHLRIIGTQDYVGAYRAILGGGNHPNALYKAKLIVVYSKLK